MSTRHHLHTLKHRALRAARATYAFLGPVAGTLKGELAKEERIRAISKAAVFGLTSGTTLVATLKQPDTLTEVVVPLTMAAMAGVFDAAFHHQCGADPAAPDPLLPPASPEAPKP